MNIVYTGAWWGVNNPYADEMSNYPLLKHLFCSTDKKKLEWINLFCQQGIEEFFNDIELINDLAQQIWGLDN